MIIQRKNGNCAMAGAPNQVPVIEPQAIVEALRVTAKRNGGPDNTFFTLPKYMTNNAYLASPEKP